MAMELSCDSNSVPTLGSPGLRPSHARLVTRGPIRGGLNYTSVFLVRRASTVTLVEVLVHQPKLMRVAVDNRTSGLSEGGGTVNHGEVFTRPWVVDLVLDLAGYTSDRNLADLRAIEPACGTGAFLIPMIHRLSKSCRLHGRTIEDAAEAIRAIDLQPENVSLSRSAALKCLLDEGWPEVLSMELADRWVVEDDFIIGEDLTGSADFVVGNPPYVRLEEIRPALSAAYRSACPTMGGRADLFIGFYEMGLRSLRPEGTLAYICADRWMHNQYGKALRTLVGAAFSMEATVVMHDVDAFEEEVSAYPAITVLRRQQQGEVLVADTTSRFDETDARKLVNWANGTRNKPKRTDGFEVAKLPHWYSGGAAWPGGSPEQLRLVADLERRFPRLEDPVNGIKVGIGVASGADKVFLTKNPSLVEQDRLLPLAMVKDTASGHFEWSGHYLVNPWDSAGLVDLDCFPRLRSYYLDHEVALRRRNVAGRRPKDWFRTIDRVDHGLVARPKLLFPDMKMAMEPVLEPGGHYPHHNIYYVVSDVWPLDVLGGLLLSQISNLFMRTYAVRMRGGTLRFQAQYMRRICVPAFNDIADGVRRQLAKAFDDRDFERATGVSLGVYGVSRTELAAINDR